MQSIYIPCHQLPCSMQNSYLPSHMGGPPACLTSNYIGPSCRRWLGRAFPGHTNRDLRNLLTPMHAVQNSDLVLGLKVGNIGSDGVMALTPDPPLIHFGWETQYSQDSTCLWGRCANLCANSTSINTYSVCVQPHARPLFLASGSLHLGLSLHTPLEDAGFLAPGQKLWMAGVGKVQCPK